MNFRQIYNLKLNKTMGIANSINKNKNRYDELYPSFIDMTLELNKMILICKEKYGYIMSDKEILKGFEGVN